MATWRYDPLSSGEFEKALGTGAGAEHRSYVDAKDLEGDYSEEATAERRRRQKEEDKRNVEGGAGVELGYVSPGAATYGGRTAPGQPTMAEFYRDQALGGMAANDQAQARTQAGLAGSLAAAQANRGPQATENAFLANREAAVRGDQMGALGLNMRAAMGGAPSAARYQGDLGMNQTLTNFATQAGQARGAAGLGGAQVLGGQQAGVAAGNVATEAAGARAQEIQHEVGQYGQLAGQVAGQDLTRLGIGNQMAQFNADLNDKWKLDQMGLAAGYGGLGVQQGAVDQQWFAESMRPEAIQFQMDQQAAGWQAGADIDYAAMAAAMDKESRINTQQIVGGAIQGGLTAVGSMAGPAGSVAGGLAGSAINSATRRFY